MPSWHQGPEDTWSFRNVASMRLPRGPFHDYQTKSDYILAYRAYKAGEIRLRDIAGMMAGRGFPLVSEKTMGLWNELYPDLPEERARAGFLPARNLPKMFSDQLRVNIKWATSEQLEHDSDSTIADFVMAVAIALAAAWALNQLSKPAGSIESPEESRIWRPRRRSGFFRVNHR